MMMNLMTRTPSVKWRLHNHAHRSRSMETVLCTERFFDDDVDDAMMLMITMTINTAAKQVEVFNNSSEE